MKIVISILLLIQLLGLRCFAQEPPIAERIYIDLPPEIRSEDVFIRYKIVTQKGSDADIVERKKGLHEYSFPVASSFPAKPELANAVVYSPGCQFKRFVVKVSGAVNPHLKFECDPLGTKHVVGTLPAKEIPKNVYFTQETRLDIVAEFSGDWICDYFLRERPDNPTLLAGSCLGAPVFLGHVGTLDPAKGGMFEVDIPDFTLDPTFKEFTNYGSVVLVLRDKTTERPLAVLRRRDAVGTANQGLEVSEKYADPLAFSSSEQ